VTRLGIGEIGGAHDGDKNLRRSDLAGKPVNDHRHRVAGVIDKQLVAADVSKTRATKSEAIGLYILKRASAKIARLGSANRTRARSKRSSLVRLQTFRECRPKSFNCKKN
jgi:hypothetical protein